MTETSHTRSRGAALKGLAVQLLAFASMLAVFFLTHSSATWFLSWYILGGVPIWFVALLVFRQRELAALEAMDLEALRREKQTSGGGEAMFGGEGGGGLGFRVAEQRLQWMLRWLVPGFGLVSAIFLITYGILGYRAIGTDPIWQPLRDVNIWLIVLAVVMLFQFLFARWASGMARAPEWQLLRGCGSYMLGNAIVTLLVIVALGVYVYTGTASWERGLAYAIPGLMILLGAETCINFVLDIYRPRTPGSEPRACFDSRLLGLIAEPGGIASSIAEALNYQFGFQVSQTWFYQLLQRTTIPLLAVGLLALWLLTGVVIVQPFEHAVVEQFGRQVNAENPLGPGLHFKWPWPIQTTELYNTGRLHELTIGHAVETAGDEDHESEEKDELQVELWTDLTKHHGGDHFNFLVAPPPGEVPRAASRPAVDLTTPDADEGRSRKWPVNILRMKVAVQYKIRPDKLAAYTSNVSDPEELLRNTVWEELVQYCATSHTHELLGRKRTTVGPELHRRIARRVDQLDLGLEIVYVGLLGVHPEKSVAEAFRNVIGAQQEKVTSIRQARVTENQTLSAVAGDRYLARRIHEAYENRNRAGAIADRTERELRAAETGTVTELRRRLEQLVPQITDHITARRDAERAAADLFDVREEFDLGMGGSLSRVAAAEARAAEARQAESAAESALQALIEPIRAEARAALGEQIGDGLVANVRAEVAQRFWADELERRFTKIEGTAAVAIAGARARRWVRALRAAGEVARFRNEYDAYQAAPRVYKTRRRLQLLSQGLNAARKYFVAFDPDKRADEVRFRIEAQEEARMDVTARPTPPAQ